MIGYAWRRSREIFIEPFTETFDEFFITRKFYEILNRYIQYFIRANVTWLKTKKNFPSHKGPLGDADLRFNSPQPQPDTSRSCKSTDTGLVCRVGCLFSSQLAPVPIYTAWWTEAVC